jgi:RND superfamily putative drug exporter
VRVGLAETSRVINCAALIMICVFSAFVLSGDLEGAMAGIGLAAAVALDAFILRTALVPAAMHLLGRSNWWLPGWLEGRLPHLAVEPAEPPAESPTGPDKTTGPNRNTGPNGNTGPNKTTEPNKTTGSDKTTESIKTAEPEKSGTGGATVVHGFLRTADGGPLAGASVTLVSRGGRQLDRVTSIADGSYIVSVPAPGAYILAVTARGLASRAHHVTVGGGPLVYDVELTDDGADLVN